VISCRDKLALTIRWDNPGHRQITISKIGEIGGCFGHRRTISAAKDTALSPFAGKPTEPGDLFHGKVRDSEA
jgi:hypothetical protein